MNTTSKKSRRVRVRLWGVGLAVAMLVAFIMTACDSFNGPWSYYPEEAEVYRGIYTHGYIVAGETPRVCFAKLYELDESSAENFAFYDSAVVKVSGKFSTGEDTLTLKPQSLKPNCFSSSDGAYGVAGESYQMVASFLWDSAGEKVHTEYSSVGTIPSKIKAVSVTPPGVNVASEKSPQKNTYDYMDFDFMEYPNDIHTYNIAMDYDESVRGILSTLSYDSVNGGESMNTTMIHMLGGFMDADSMGYYGIVLKSPDESVAQMGFQSRSGGMGSDALDTIMVPGMSLPIGKSTMRFYATDQAYVDYKNTLLQSFEDSRIVVKTNIQNGMGVFSGMLRDSMLFNIKAEDYITYQYAMDYACNTEDEFTDKKAWDTKACRLYEESYCIDSLADTLKKYEEHCYPIAVSYALRKGADLLYLMIPSSDSIYAMGREHYCFESNFKSVEGTLDCDDYKQNCLYASVSTTCNEYAWKWCADRNWDIETYPQCGTALIERYKVNNLKSDIFERVISAWCATHKDDKQCEN